MVAGFKSFTPFLLLIKGGTGVATILMPWLLHNHPRNYVNLCPVRPDAQNPPV
jgi:hypothetical protein